MKYLLFTIFSFLLINPSQKIKNNITKNKPAIVLQLFTSQGCSSCPKADILLEEIKGKYKNKNVIVLSYHVDYWNYLGWKDPFSSKDFTNLQYRYANQFQSKRVYTPQTIVNGKEHYVGSSRVKITKSINENLVDEATNTIEFKNIRKKNGVVNFDYNIDGKIENRKLQVRLVLDQKTTNVKRGENTNRTISNSNIVIQMKSLNLKENNNSVSIAIPNQYKKEKNLRLIAFIEDDNLHISGATEIRL